MQEIPGVTKNHPFGHTILCERQIRKRLSGLVGASGEFGGRRVYRDDETELLSREKLS